MSQNKFDLLCRTAQDKGLLKGELKHLSELTACTPELEVKGRGLLQFLTTEEHLQSFHSMNCFEKSNLQRDYKSHIE